MKRLRTHNALMTLSVINTTSIAEEPRPAHGPVVKKACNLYGKPRPLDVRRPIICETLLKKDILEIEELRESLHSQTATPTGIYRDPFSTPANIEEPDSSNISGDYVGRKVGEQMEQGNCLKLPSFVDHCVSDDDECDPSEGRSVAWLQRYFLLCKARGDNVEALEVQRKLFERFERNYCVLPTSFGLIERANETDLVLYRWALMYSSLFCCTPTCHKALEVAQTHSDDINTLVFYKLDCGHASRFCSECASGEDSQVTCPMCGSTGKPKEVTVFQGTGGRKSPHTTCFNEPCSCCSNINL